MDLERVVAAAFIDEMQKVAADTGAELPAFDEEQVLLFLKEAGISNIIQGGIGAAKNFGKTLQSGFNKVKSVAGNELGHLQTAVGGRMAKPNTSFSKFMPGETAGALKAGLGGAVDYAKGLTQRVAPSFHNKLTDFAKNIAAKTTTQATSKNTATAGEMLHKGVGSQIAQGAQDYLHQNHPVMGGIIGGAVSNLGQAATNMGGKVISAFQSFRPPTPGLQKAASIDAFFDELEILGELTQLTKQADQDPSNQAIENAVARYETLDRNKPTLKQVGRYSLIGATSAPIIGAIGDAIQGGKGILGSEKGVKGVIRGVASASVKGAIGSGLVPLVRSHLDRQSEKAQLRQLISKKLEKASALSGAAPTEPWAANEAIFKEGAGASTRGGFLMSSEIPPFRMPAVKGPVKTAGAATTPAGRLSQSKAVGLPKKSPGFAPGSPVADLGNNRGRRLPGANKTVVGDPGYKPVETMGGMVM